MSYHCLNLTVQAVRGLQGEKGCVEGACSVKVLCEGVRTPIR